MYFNNYLSAQEVTIYVNGPWTYTVVSSHESVQFVNVRFEVWNEGELILDLDEAIFRDTDHTVNTHAWNDKLAILDALVCWYQHSVYTYRT